MVGKFTAFASKESMKRETEKLRKMHSDIWTASRNQSFLREAAGFQSMICDATRYSELKLYKKGSQVLSNTDAYLKEKTTENHDVCLVVEIRFDSGEEFGGWHEDNKFKNMT
jgi:hypothetical protein